MPEPGAAPFRLSSVVRAMAKAGHTVDVLTSRAPRTLRDEKRSDLESVAVKRFPVLRDSAGYVRGYVQYMSFDIPLAFRLLFSKRPDVVLAEPPPTSGAVVRVVCRLRRIPYVYYAADIWSDASASAGAPLAVISFVRWLERFAMRGAARVVSVSDGVTKRLRELGVADSVVTVGNGVDLSWFERSGPAKTLGSPYLVYTGTASEVHGARIFADAFRTVLEENPDARLVFVGQGSEYDAIREVAAELPDGAVLLLPRTSPEEVGEWLRGARGALASVKPGVGYDFAFPTKLYAAASCGTPPVFAGVGPGAEFVQELEFGTAVEYDVAAVAEAMKQMLRADIEIAERDRVAREARKRVDIRVVAGRVRDVLEQAAVTGSLSPQRKTES